MVVTDWMVARLARLGWLETIDTSVTPNFVANLAENYKGRSFDPDTNLAAPWQSGMTGLGFDQKKTGPLDSIEVLFTDQFKGQLTYLSRDARHHRAVGGPAWQQARGADAGAVRCRPRRGRQGHQGRDRPPGNGQLLRRGHGRRKRDRGDGLVRRRAHAARARADGRPGLPVGPPEGGRDALDRQHGHPEGLAQQAAGRALDRLLLRARQRGDDRGVRQLRLPGRRRARRPCSRWMPNSRTTR